MRGAIFYNNISNGEGVKKNKDIFCGIYKFGIFGM